MAISPADMVLFSVVVREGGFTRAAKSLGLTKQTVSERIAKLERELGVRLLERTTRRLRLTDSGAAYNARCAAIGAQIDEANREVRALQAEPVGLLRISVPTLYGRRYLRPIVAGFLAQHPKVKIEVVLTDRRVSLIEEGFDLAIRIGELDDSSLTARKLGEGHVYYVASPAFLAAAGSPTAETIAAFRCVGMQPFETWEVDGVRAKIEAVLVVNDLEMGCDAAVAGVGIARLPGIACREAVRDGRLKLLFGARASTRPVYAVFPSRQHLPPKVRLFVEALAAEVEPMEPLELGLAPPSDGPRPKPRTKTKTKTSARPSSRARAHGGRGGGRAP